MEIINIIITGADGSLVSKFIESASGAEAITLRKKFSADFPWQEMELGRVNIGQSNYLYLVGTPLEDEYKVIWQRAAKDLAGMVVIVSPQDPKNEIAKAKTLLNKLATMSLPYLLIFNKVDNAAAGKKLRHKLNLAPECQPINADVSSKDESKQAILSLLLSNQDEQDDGQLKSA